MMKEYVEKQFIDGEKYIEAIPSGFPDWWRDFTEIVNKSLGLQPLFIELMDFEPYRDLPKFVNGQIVFNPLVYDFLIKNKEWIIVFRKGHLKGAKYFKKTYFKKYPNEREMNIINNLYHNDFKQTILRGDGFFNQSKLEMLGYYNGILTAYWNFEIDYLRDFIANNSDESTPEAKETFRFENEFDKVPEDEVYKYFYENLVKRKFLTEKQLHEYLKMAFEKPKEQIKKRIDFLEPPKVSTIVNIFYTYYLEVAKKPHGKKMDYCGLLGEYFNDYTTKKVSDNFSKNYQKVRK